MTAIYQVILYYCVSCWLRLERQLMLTLAITVLRCIYVACVFILAIYTTGQLYLLITYIRHWNSPALKSAEGEQQLPHVTVQLPLFNERYVARRIVEAVAMLDYPRDRLHIQVLDDSTD